MRFLDCWKDAEEWDRLVPTQDPHFASAYYRAYGAGTLATLYIENMDILICQPFRHQENGWIGNAFNYGGPISKSKNVEDFFLKYFNEWKQKEGLNERCSISPFLGQHVYADNIVTTNVVVVDLRLIKQPKRRIWRCIEKGRKDCLLSRPVLPTELNIFAFEELYLKNMADKEADQHWVYPPGFFYQVLNELGRDRSTLFLTYRNAEIVGGGLFIHDPRVCYYHWTARKPDVPNVEHVQAWAAINWAASLDMQYFHFGGGLKANDSLFEFKQGFSDVVMPCRRYVTLAKKEVA